MSTLPSTPRAEVVTLVARPVPVRDDAGCVRVAVDGVDGSGKSTFARELAQDLEANGRHAVQVSADGYLNPRAVRHRRGRSSPEGFWLDSYDYHALTEELLAPLGPTVTAPRCTTWLPDQPVDGELLGAPPGSVLVVDGIFLHRDELAGVWDFSVFLHVPFDVAAQRMAVRDGTHPDFEHPTMTRYDAGQRLYFAACRPWRRATLVLDSTDPGRLRPALELKQQLERPPAETSGPSSRQNAGRSRSLKDHRLECVWVGLCGASDGDEERARPQVGQRNEPVTSRRLRSYLHV